MAELEQPIIIKKVYKQEGGHHGGAWKVAYADFVTAMMAFFLLLWLLNAAEEETLEGIADYFSPTIGLADEKGIGFEGGQTDSPDGTQRNDKTPPGIITGQPPEGVKPGPPDKKAIIENEAAEQMLFDNAGNTMSELMYQDPTLGELKDNIQMRQTPEGLVIQVMDTEKEPMFRPGKPYLTDAGKRLMAATAEVIKGMPNFISITGHTDARPYNRRVGYSNWELSADRANAARRFLVDDAGMIKDRVSKVLGRAAKDLLLPAEPLSPKNRRIEITLLRGQFMAIPLMDRPSAEGLNPFKWRPTESTLDYEREQTREDPTEVLPDSNNGEPEEFQPYTVIPDAPIVEESLEFNNEFVPY